MIVFCEHAGKEKFTFRQQNKMPVTGKFRRKYSIKKKSLEREKVFSRMKKRFKGLGKKILLAKSFFTLSDTGDL